MADSPRMRALREGREPQVDVKNLWRSTPVGGVPLPEERAVLRLARAIHAAESTFCATSWSAQERAGEYFNANGLGATLDEATRLEALRLPSADT